MLPVFTPMPHTIQDVRPHRRRAIRLHVNQWSIVIYPMTQSHQRRSSTMPLFPQLPVPTPWYLAHESNAGVTASGSAALVTNTTYLVGVWLPVPATVTNLRVRHSGTSAGNLDMGIYDASGNRLDHTGVTAVT